MAELLDELRAAHPALGAGMLQPVRGADAEMAVRRWGGPLEGTKVVLMVQRWHRQDEPDRVALEVVPPEQRAPATLYEAWGDHRHHIPEALSRLYELETTIAWLRCDLQAGSPLPDEPTPPPAPPAEPSMDDPSEGRSAE